jgi:ribonuclease T2
MHNSTSKPVAKQRVSIEDELNKADANMAKKPQKHFTKKTTSSKQNLLALSWHNAFCETHRYKKECKRGLSDLLKRKMSDTQFVLHGLWPQPRNNVYCNVERDFIEADKRKRWRDLPCLALDDDVEKELEKIMPGFSSELHKHEWVKHGTCYGTDANTYYRDAINLVKQINTSALGKFFTQNIGKRITLREVQTLADKSFGRGTGSRVTLQCNRGMVTELWLNLGSGSKDLATLLKRGKPKKSRCKGGYIDKAGYGR